MPKRAPRWLAPREHGSWGLLLFPAVSSAVLAKSWSWPVLVALAAMTAAFLTREPLAVLLRQKLRWSERRPETAAALRTLAVAASVAVVCAAGLVPVVGLAWLAGFGLLGAALAALFLVAEWKGRQRSTAVQIIGACGLTAAAALPWKAAGREPDALLLILCCAHAVHSIGAVLTVHARLEALRQLKADRGERAERRAAAVWQGIQLGAASAVWAWGAPLAGAALVTAAGLHARDLFRLQQPGFVRTPLVQVGVRELLVSFAASVAFVVSLW